MRRSVRTMGLFLAAATLSACADHPPTATDLAFRQPPVEQQRTVQALECSVQVRSGAMHCAPPANPGRGSALIFGSQGTYVKLVSTNVQFDSVTGIFGFDITVQNLLNEAIGTPDGTMADTNGIRVFFHSGPYVISGAGTITVANADGTANFSAANQPYFAYHEILEKNEVSAPKRWELQLSSGVQSFGFKVYVDCDVQPLLVINEVVANPGGTISDANGEWFELYNAGTLPVHLQNLVVADSAAAGRRPYHLITSTDSILSGGYYVLGATTNTTLNGGVPVNYAYGTALSLANSLDAIKISRVYGTDTLTIDRVRYANGAISAQDGISRELINPSLDNSDVDGSNWADASTTAVYGSGGRGTPRARNSAFVP